MNFAMQSIYNWYRGLLKHPKYRWWVVLGSFLYLTQVASYYRDWSFRES
jgi:uncharacterized membrane protein YkvA (DUF1232 family)